MITSTSWSLDIPTGSPLKTTDQPKENRGWEEGFIPAGFETSVAELCGDKSLFPTSILIKSSGADERARRTNGVGC